MVYSGLKELKSGFIIRLKRCSLFFLVLENLAFLLPYLPTILGDENEFKLTRYLLAGYDKCVRPSRNASEPLNVTFGLALTQIIDVDERNQILTTNCWLNQNWIDHNLYWNASHFGGVHVIRLPADKVWKPDIILYNNADSQYNNAILSTNVIVASDGNLTWLSSAIFKSSCKIDVSWFPFDEQTCTMKFASWTYDGYQVNLAIQTTEGDLSNYVENGEWDLIDMIVQRNEVFYSCCKEPYPDITYSIVLRRRPLFYVFNLILPCVLITGIALLSFYMPSDSGEKVTLGITTLLSMTVFLMVIGESMPPTSDTVPLIGLYYGVTISLVSLTTALSVVTLNLHHRGIRGSEVPSCVKKIVFGVLAKILFIRIEDTSTAIKNCVDTKKKYQRAPADITVETEKFENNKMVNPNVRSEYLGGTAVMCPANDPFESQFLRVLNKVQQTIESNESRIAERERRDTIKTEWQQVALIMDRFLLWLFVVLTIGTTFGILSMSPHARLY